MSLSIVALTLFPNVLSPCSFSALSIPKPNNTSYISYQ